MFNTQADRLMMTLPHPDVIVCFSEDPWETALHHLSVHVC
ncbi:hypothetical protein AB205_0205280 [Aquarana catesbeiana]|uniref:Uncharacterized protein n=1 Tax=Aquarana catesbeiana TaxID=8400 RepID=A0A2G9SFC8_AQUCT|nr:hypothetical protein AB205_0205280 [Aquarana catesbeiana]